ncbi:hypothetical protein F2S75_05680 [Pseudomonas syringae pv. actinidiae]|uniref:hypothetical protein n=1 Tax=Pseudomonas syringae TaxID=317 RepID=UPI0011106B6B|nr:hypothetical protein [Pseudomonas syringae]NVL45923.1 hypothetical protein [Pseudomonas syringae pv. actinidiae]
MDFMPSNWLTESLLRNFKVGSVVYTWCDFCEPAKNKYLVVVSLDPSLLVLVVNTNINQFYFDRGQEGFHVLVPVAEHQFLAHDSYACCVEAIEAFDLTYMKAQVVEKYNDFHRGHLTSKCLVDVYRAVLAQGVMRRGLKRQILSSLEAELYSLVSD